MIQARDKDGKWAECELNAFDAGTGIATVTIKATGDKLTRSMIRGELTATKGLDEILRTADEL